MVQRDAITVLQCITALSWCSAIMYFNMPKTFKRRIDSNSTVPICIYRLYRCLVDSDVLILVAQRCLRSSLYSITFSMGLFRIMELSLRARFTHDLCWPETGLTKLYHLWHSSCRKSSFCISKTRLDVTWYVRVWRFSRKSDSFSLWNGMSAWMSA
jgi:hypothetical protein